MATLRIILSTFFLSGFIGCSGSSPDVLRVTPEGSGPVIIHAPLEIPDAISFFPSDMSTRIDDSSPTGRRLNVSINRALDISSHLRQQLNNLDGFSVVAPISIPFDQPIAYASIKADDIKLFNVTPDSPGFGEEITLDIDGSHYPTTFRPREVFPYDQFADLPDLFFGDDNWNGDERVPNYEVETNTLLLRPHYPLRQMTTYAVVVTEAVKDEAGNPVRSPFPGVHHASDYQTLKPIADWINVSEIAFAWSFTTRSITPAPEAIRDGLDKKGPLKWLGDMYPGKWQTFENLDVDDTPAEAGKNDHPWILDGEFLPEALSSIGAIAGGGLDSIQFNHVDYAVFGEFESVDLRGEDGTIQVDLTRGETAHAPATVGFLLTVPKATEEHQAPFPVMLYNHGSRTSRLEQILMANDFSRAGIAVMSIDAVGHGPFGGDLRTLVEREAANVPEDLAGTIAGVIAQSFLGSDYTYDGKELDAILDDLEENGLWQALFVQGRSEDLDLDGVLMSGDSYYVPNPFELAANGLQTVIDNMVLLRMMRRFENGKLPGSGIATTQNAEQEEIWSYMRGGDFNADGQIDVGGPAVDYFTMGTSMGAFHSTILLPLEPLIRTGVSNVGGGGLAEIMLRSSLAEVIDSIMVEPLGPVIVGCPVPKEDEEAVPTEVAMTWNNWSIKCRDRYTIQFAESVSGMNRIPALPGGKVTLSNPKLENSGEESSRSVTVAEDGGFSIAIGADEGDLLELVLEDEDGNEIQREMVEALQSGSGFQRNSPRFRRLVSIAQSGLDTMDPLAWARHIIHEPLGDGQPNNVLHLADVGDVTVPFSTMLAWARGVGLLGKSEEETASVMEKFTQDNRILGAQHMWDHDNLQGASDGPGPLPVIETNSGVSAIRFPYTDDHEFLGLLKPDASFDWAMYYRNQSLHFLRTNGDEVRDEPCMEDNSCTWLPSPSQPDEN